jgi:hypothetical protein
MFLNGEVKSLLLVFFGTGPAELDTRMDTVKPVFSQEIG